jgi:hypothetical protein
MRGREGDGLTVCRLGWRGEGRGGEGERVRRGEGEEREGWGRGGQQLECAGMVCRLPATGAAHMTQPRAAWGYNTREQRGGEGEPSTSTL